MTLSRQEAIISRMKEEIQRDSDERFIPSLRNVDSFAQLHDFVDANEYGGFFESQNGDLTIEEMNKCQSIINEWLKSIKS